MVMKMRLIKDVFRTINSQSVVILENALTSKIYIGLNVDENLSNIIANQCIRQLEYYKDSLYYFNPVCVPKEESEDEQQICVYIYDYACLKIMKYFSNKTEILNSTNEDLKSLINLEMEKSTTKTYANEEGISGTYAMNENAPINANLTEINTPHMKSQASGNSTRTFLNPEEYKEKNPYYYEKYMQILSKYNIMSLISEAVKTTIYEFNTLI